MTDTRPTSVFTLLLRALGVPCTYAYSEQRYATMPFHTMFGLTRLLDEYGIDSEGIRLDDRTQLSSLPTPFVACCGQEFIVVTDTGSASIEQLTPSGRTSTPLDTFLSSWDGVALLATPRPGSTEPAYATHRFTEIGRRVMRRLFALSAIFLIAYAFIAQRLYTSVPAILVALFDMAGLYVSYLLILKTLHIESAAADRMCSALQSHGCDHVLSRSASSFFGLFGWSEVGAVYFSVSLLTLLLFPSAMPWLAAVNVCCLPFSFWSVWYQHFRAKAWCTLCLTVQTLLWLLFLSYLPTLWWRHLAFPSWTPIVLVATYFFVLCAANRIVELLTPPDDNTEES
ncbi:MAG: cysteine peptidase family C39 domain-containing protein [Muribaculaceae bacterium]|nr:cysteine peptidase family C39 domain-containing protein [Muribaculaceae bacterium]